MAGAPWQSYDSVAREYDRAWHPSFGPVARDLLELVALEPHEAMLDVGTGTGVVAAAAAERIASGVVVGVDPSLPMLHLARDHTTAPLRAALEGGGLRSVDLRSRTYRRCVSQRDALAGSETSFWGRYLRHALGDAEWARFRREVAAAAAEALPDPITRVDQLLIGVGTKRFETRP